jgi:putative phosphoribosyl transferase
LPAERPFRDRVEAGERLAEHLLSALRPAPTVVLGVARGGVIVALPVARALGAPLDVVVPRKVGAPENPELAVAALALAEGEEILVRDEESIAYLGISEPTLERLVRAERQEIERRLKAYREGRAGVCLQGKRALIVDDGLATGLTTRAAAAAVERSHPDEVVIAAPVVPRNTELALRRLGLRVEACLVPTAFQAVGEFYLDFSPVPEEDVRRALRTPSI